MPDFEDLDINGTRQIIQDCHSITVITGGNLYNGHFNPIIQDLVHHLTVLLGLGYNLGLLEGRMGLFIIHSHTHILPLNKWITERHEKILIFPNKKSRYDNSIK